jgi:hypothetical protein
MSLDVHEIVSRSQARLCDRTHRDSGTVVGLPTYVKMEDNLVGVFRRHADDCRDMAREASEPSRRAAWEAMAERWASAAEAQRALKRAAHDKACAPKEPRRVAKRWASRV